MVQSTLFEFGLDPKQDLFCKTGFTLLCSVLYLVQWLFQRKQAVRLYNILIRVIIFFRYFLLILTWFGRIEVLGMAQET